MFEIPKKIPLNFLNSHGDWNKIFSPNDHNLLTEIQFATNEDIDHLLKETKSIQKSFSRLRPYERSQILKDASIEVKKNQEFLAMVIATEGGKPLKDARVEVERAAATLDLCAEETLRLNGEVIPMERTASGKNHLAFTIREPIGAVLAICAFNHPLNLIAHQVGCAIAGGCSVVLKPAPSTPLSAYFIEEIFKKAGLPKNTLRIIHAEIPLIQKLVSSPEFDFVSFIGSAKVGWELRKFLSEGTRLALEHGGQAPAIVRHDADLNITIPALVRGAFYHAGQVCISTQMIFVHDSIFEVFLKQFKEASEKLVVGDARDEKTDVGPLIRPLEVVRIQKLIKEAIDKGAKLISGNIVSGDFMQFLSPTILSHAPEESSIMKDEIFGPVVCINSYKNEEQVLEYINSNQYIFESSLFTQDITTAFKMATEISTMTFVINNHTAFRVDQMPFGGHKKSGLGMGGVRYSMDEMTRLKQIIIKI